jgi:apolipoprotein D and lipocalin family protein
MNPLVLPAVALILGMLMCSTAGAMGPQPAHDVVPSVNIAKYMGTWHEIARYPNRFQKKCAKTWVRYSLRDDGDVKVENFCTTVDGNESSITGKAWSVDPRTNARLKVQFFWPFRGNYWVIQLDDDYRYAVVGNPKKNLLWILSREPQLEETVLNGILRKLVQQGYDPERLIWSPNQPRP